MKNIYIKIGVIAIFINSIFGLIFKNYETFNWLTSDVVIILNVFFLQTISYSKISDGFKVALNFIFPILGMITLILSIRMESKLENNIVLSSILVVLAIQTILLVITDALQSKK